ncbi:MAG: response regulator [Gammaproteobacteria bacterium]|nr:response regulator [Gammaproteobacteria bacterium]
MKLEFMLLVVDDRPDSIGQAINTLREHLEERGFSLNQETETDVSDEKLQRLARLQGRNYDLVVIDYNLGTDKRNGAEVARRLRRNLPYTDMVFYSSDPTANLFGELADHEVVGVFPSTRDQLDDALTGLADTVIGKAVDLNHMRGIAMAEVAELDVLMEETLACVFRSSDERVAAVAKKTVAKLRKGICRIKKTLDKRLEEEGLASVASDGKMFQHAQKYWAVRRLAKRLPEIPSDELSTLRAYDNDVIKNRNLLAHAKEHPSEDGNMELRSIHDGESPIVINEEWMTDFRRKLHMHRRALTVVCEAIRADYGR